MKPWKGRVSNTLCTFILCMSPYLIFFRPLSSTQLEKCRTPLIIAEELFSLSWDWCLGSALCNIKKALNIIRVTSGLKVWQKVIWRVIRCTCGWVVTINNLWLDQWSMLKTKLRLRQCWDNVFILPQGGLHNVPRTITSKLDSKADILLGVLA